MGHTRRVLAIVCCIAGMGLAGCEVPTQQDFDDVVQAVLNTATLTNTASVVYSITQGVNPQGVLLDRDGCPQVTLQGQAGARTLTIDYAQGCSSDNLTLSGSITGSWEYASGQLAVALTMNDFQVEDRLTSGTVNMHAEGAPGEGIMVTLGGTLTVNGRTLSVPAATATVNLNKTLLVPDDDTYEISGSGTFSTEEGKTYSIEFDRVAAKFLCYVPVSGSMLVKSTSPRYTAIVDFGAGACDTIVKVTIGFTTREIDLKKWFDAAMP